MPEVATPNQGEREFETGSDETSKNNSELNQTAAQESDRIIAANKKRTYDVYQDLDIQAVRRGSVEVARLDNIGAQALQNAVETANMVAKQYLRHSDLAADSFWNPVSAGAGMNLTAGAVPANRVTDTAAAGVAATIPASSDVRIVAVVESIQNSLAAQAALLAELVGKLTSPKA